jgi:hypothetical protein
MRRRCLHFQMARRSGSNDAFTRRKEAIRCKSDRRGICRAAMKSRRIPFRRRRTECVASNLVRWESPRGFPTDSRPVRNGRFARRVIAVPRSCVTAGNRANCRIVSALHFYGVFCKGGHSEFRHIAVIPRSLIMVAANVTQCNGVSYAESALFYLNGFWKRFLLVRIPICRAAGPCVGGGRWLLPAIRYRLVRFPDRSADTAGLGHKSSLFDSGIILCARRRTRNGCPERDDGREARK